MTISNQTNTTSVTGTNTVGQEVPFEFKITDTSDLSVISRVTATGVPTTLAETTNYTVVISGTGGTVTMVTAVATTAQIHVTRDTPMTQPLDLVAGGSFNPNDIEAALDKNTKLIQENGNEITNKCLTFPETDPTTLTSELPTVTDRASKVISCDSVGSITAITAVPTGSVAFTTFGENMAEAANAAAGLGVLGLDDGSTGLDLAATSITTLTVTDIVSSGPILDIRAFGTTDATGAVDSSAAIQAAIDAVPAVGGTVFIPAGIWLIETGLTWTNAFVVFRGVGKGFAQDSVGSIIRKGANMDMLTIANTDDQGFVISDLKFEGVRGSFTGGGIILSDTKGFLIQDVTIRNQVGVALSVTDCGVHRLNNVHCAQSEDHIIRYSGGGDWAWMGVEADNSLASGSDKDAVHIINSKGSITGGHFEGGVTKGRYGVNINTGSIVHLVGNWVGFSGQHGIHIASSDGCSVVGNRVYTNNQLDQANIANINIADSDRCMIVGNTSDDLGGVALVDYGIRVTGDENVISANRFSNHTTAAALVSGDRNLFSHNFMDSVELNANAESNRFNGNIGLVTVTDSGVNNRFKDNPGHLVDNGVLSHNGETLYLNGEQLLLF